MAACLVRAREDAIGTLATRVEELEADSDELDDGERVLQFLMACGQPEEKAKKTLRGAQAKGAEFGGVLLRVRVGPSGGRVEVLPTEVAALPVPSVAAGARRAADLQIPA